MMHLRLPKSWRHSLARAGVLLGAFGSMALSAMAEDATTVAEQAKRRLAGDVVQTAPSSDIYQVSALSMEACAPSVTAEPNCVFTDPGCSAPASSGCDSDGGCPPSFCSGWGVKGPLGDPYKLSTALGSKIDFGGWTDIGFQSKPDLSFTQPNESGKVHLAQQYAYVQKVADGSNGLDWGFRFDALYGIDGNDAQAFGNPVGRYDNGGSFNHTPYEWALPQLYGELAFGDFSVKFGHFYTIVGYEVVTAPDNFFYSRQVNFWNSEPFTHTGALSTYKATDKLTIWNGFVYGWDTGFDRYNGGAAYLGGLSYVATDKLTLTYTTNIGDLGWRGQGAVNSFIASYALTEKWQWVGQFDVLGTDNNVGTPFAINPVTGGVGGVARNSTGLINYFFYTINDRWKAGSRFEWYKADGNSLYEMTYGVNYKPHANVVLRPEIRHQWQPGGPYNATIAGIDAIIKY